MTLATKDVTGILSGTCVNDCEALVSQFEKACTQLWQTHALAITKYTIVSSSI